VVIGKKGEDIEKLRKEVSDMMGVPAHINVSEVRKPELDAQLVAESIAQQLERRIMFRRAMKRAVGNAMRLGALGIKVNVAGRLNGAEIARSEWYREGRVPLHTLRADIDYGFAEAKTTYGIIGVKTWIYKGDVFDSHGQKRPGEEHDVRNAARERGDRVAARGPWRSRSEVTNHAATQSEPSTARSTRAAIVACPQRRRRQLRRIRSEGDHPWPPHRTPDRGRASYHLALREAWRQAVDPRVPGQADHQEADRSPHGQRQGQRGILGRPDPARSHALRDRGRPETTRARRSAWPRPSSRFRPPS
jgi:ribosomal protein S3